MDREELQEFGTRLNDRIRAALEQGDFDKALALCETVAKDYVYMMKGLRLVIETLFPFVEERFREAQARLADQIREAIARREAPEARRLLQDKDDQFRPIHDFYIKIMATMFSYTYEQFGDQALLGLFRHAAEGQKRGFEKWEGLSPEDFVRTTAFLMKSHMGQLRIEEDDEKFTFIQDPCGTGGRLQREGAYDGPGATLARIKKAQPMTFGRENFPVYCAHCAVWNGILTTEWFGRIHWAFTPPESPEKPCVFRIYKEAKGIPEGFYRALGLERPGGQGSGGAGEQGGTGSVKREE